MTYQPLQSVQADRQAFETFVSRPPFEKSVARHPEDDRRTAWPGNYRDIAVDLAWHAWCAALVAVGADPDQPGDWHLEFVRLIEAAHGVPVAKADSEAAPPSEHEIAWTDEDGAHHSMSSACAVEILRTLFAKFPAGFCTAEQVRAMGEAAPPSGGENISDERIAHACEEWNHAIATGLGDAVAASRVRSILSEAAPKADGCNLCRHPLYAGTKCKNCGRVSDTKGGQHG